MTIDSDPIEFECRKIVSGEPGALGEDGLGIWHKIRCIPSLDASTGNFAIIVVSNCVLYHIAKIAVLTCLSTRLIVGT